MPDPTTTSRRAAAAAVPNEEATMARAIPTMHPAAVVRSRRAHPRILLATSMIAVVGLAAAVEIIAGDDGGTTATPTIGRSVPAGRAIGLPPGARVPTSSSSVCSRPDQRRCTPSTHGAPGASLQLAPQPAGRRPVAGPERAPASSSPR
jgi:hypothetical protein